MTTYSKVKNKLETDNCFCCGVTNEKYFLYKFENTDLKICFDCKMLIKNINLPTIKSIQNYVRRNFKKVEIKRTSKRCENCDIPFYDFHSLSKFCPNCLPQQCINIELWKKFLLQLSQMNIDVKYYQAKSLDAFNIDTSLIEEVGQFTKINYYFLLSIICLQLSNKKIFSELELKDTFNLINNKLNTKVSYKEIKNVLLDNSFLYSVDESFINSNNFYLSKFDKKLKGSQLEQCAENFLIDNVGFILTYKKEFTEHNCVFNKNVCRFDFMFQTEHKKYILELHGAQHFTIVERFKTTIKDVELQQQIDGYKKFWALENGYEYIMIPFYASVEKMLIQALR